MSEREKRHEERYRDGGLELAYYYDTKDFYDTISCRDYLLYYLAHSQKAVDKAISVSNAGEWKAKVSLYLTDIKGRVKKRKKASFGINEVREIEKKLSVKKGAFYAEQETWAALTRVERGKVSNAMRFAVYARDGYRCKKCGRRHGRLEVDHIYPIAKGGKSTFDNLQTLCHRCNVKKGANIE